MDEELRRTLKQSEQKIGEHVYKKVIENFFNHGEYAELTFKDGSVLRFAALIPDSEERGLVVPCYVSKLELDKLAEENE